MIGFWIVAASLVAASVAVLLPALLRAHSVDGAGEASQRAALYRQQQREMLQDSETGLLHPTHLPQAALELDQRILAETALSTPGLRFQPERKLAVGLALALPLLSVLLYLRIGDPQAIGDPLAQPVPAVQQANVEPILDRLLAKLQKDPGDGAGWELLGKAYIKLHRYDEASQAYAHAVEAIPDDAALLVDYAIALAFTNQRKLQGKPEALIEQALKLDPDYPKAMMLAASAAYDRKDYPQAIAYWQRLLPRLPADSEAARSITQALEEAQALQQAGSSK